MSCAFITHLSVDFKCAIILNKGHKWWDSSKEHKTLQSNVYEPSVNNECLRCRHVLIGLELARVGLEQTLKYVSLE